MKNHILPAIKLTLLCIIFFMGIYPLTIWGLAQLAPNHGMGEIVMHNGNKYYLNVGQKFTEDNYFNSRPSAVAYNAAGSGSSNKGPTNPEYLSEVQSRIDTFLRYNPEIKKLDIPSDLVTASGSGLDPNISVQAAMVQIPRIASIRKLEKKDLELLVQQQIQKPFLNLLGTEKINVLSLNLALDSMAKSN